MLPRDVTPCFLLLPRLQPTETTFSVRSSSISFTEPCVKMLLRFVEPKGADSGSSGGGGGDGGGAAGTLQGVCYVLLSPDQWRLTDVLFTWDAASGKELSRKVLVSSPDDGYRLVSHAVRHLTAWPA